METLGSHTHNADLEMTDVLVLGEGPTPATGMLVGQNPGADEALMLIQYGLTPRPFVGQAGQELDEYLSQCQIARSELYITNAFKHYTHMNARPTVAQLDSHWDILMMELEAVNPLVIGGLGDCASEYISAKAGMEFRSMEAEHGIPRWIEINQHHYILVPITHPAAGLHNPDSMGKIFYDFQMYTRVLRGELSPGPVEVKEFGCVNITTFKQLAAIPFHKLVAIDTESVGDVMWGLTFAVDEHTGYRIGSEQPALLDMFNQIIHILRLTIILQNSLHDIPVLKKLGVDVTDLPIIDTMVLAYGLCVEPQGLKPLGWRWLRANMEEYGKLADPVTEQKTAEFIQKVLETDWDECPVCGLEGGLGKKHQHKQKPFLPIPLELVEQIPGPTLEECPSTILDYNYLTVTFLDPAPFLTPKGNIKKKFQPFINWCEGGGKSMGKPMNKRLQRMLEGLEDGGEEGNGDADTVVQQMDQAPA